MLREMSIISSIYLFVFVMFIYLVIKDFRGEIDYDKIVLTVFTPMFLYTLFFVSLLKIIIVFFGLENLI